jgi:hypothetical protein
LTLAGARLVGDPLHRFGKRPAAVQSNAQETKIVASIGPASEQSNTVRATIEAGRSIARLNFSHGSRVHHAELIGRIREAAAATGRRVAIMGGPPGPKIRIGDLAEKPVEPPPDGDSAANRLSSRRPLDSVPAEIVEAAGLARLQEALALPAKYGAVGSDLLDLDAVATAVAFGQLAPIEVDEAATWLCIVNVDAEGQGRELASQRG